MPITVCVCVCVCTLSRAQFFATPWTVAHQGPLSMKCSGKNTGVGCHFLLQEIFLTKGLNPRLLPLQVLLPLPLLHLGSPCASYLMQNKQTIQRISDKCFRLSQSLQPRVQGISKGGLASKKGGSVYMLNCCCCLVVKSCPTLLWPRGL